MSNAMIGREKITIADVSRLAGCSRGVVSAVVNKARGNIAVSEATRQRVLAAAAQLGYRPNFASRSLARRATHTIGIYVPPSSSLGYAYEGRILHGIEETCRERSYDLLILSMGGGLTPDQCSHKIAEGRIDGLLLIQAHEDADWVQPLLEQTRNVVAVNYYGPVLALDTVLFDDVAAARLATRHLIELGHRRIAYVGGVHFALGAGGERRGEGYRREMAAHDLPLDPAWIWDFTNPYYGGQPAPGWDSGEGAVGIDHLLRLPPERRPTAVICYDDTFATAGMQRLAELGLNVPRDLSVMGIDDAEIAQRMYPRLSSIRQPLENMGRRAAHLLIDKAAGRDAPPLAAPPGPVHELWPPELRVRQSTAAPGGLPAGAA